MSRQERILGGSSSTLRDLVEDVSEAGLGIEGSWSWTPKVRVDPKKLLANSPTTEYSPVESKE